MIMILYSLILATMIIGMCLIYKIFTKIIFPWIVDKNTKIIEVNPKWITPKLQNLYYGFKDMDIVIVNSPLGMIPRFKLAEGSKERLQLLISEDVSTKDVDDIAQLALVGKIKIKYNLWFPDKPVYWLSILNYLLDGGEVKVGTTKWEDT